MLSEDLDRHISLHHALGFKFRTQALLLRNFVAYAEARGDQVVSADRILAGRWKRHRLNSGAIVSFKRGASRSRCMRRTTDTRFPTPTRSGAACSRAGFLTSTAMKTSAA